MGRRSPERFARSVTATACAQVAAEGVETATALALLQGTGYDIAQGHFIGRPMPIADLIVRLGEPAVPGVVSTVLPVRKPLSTVSGALSG